MMPSPSIASICASLISLLAVTRKPTVQNETVVAHFEACGLLIPVVPIIGWFL